MHIVSIRYVVRADLGFSLTVWRDVVTAEEMLAHMRRMASDPAWPEAQRRHLSLLNAARLDESIDEGILREAANLLGEQRHKLWGLRVAIVPDGAFEKAIAFERLIANFGTTAIAFNIFHEACRWLGLPAEQVEGAILALEQDQGE